MAADKILKNDVEQSWLSANLQLSGVIEIVSISGIIPCVIFWYASPSIVNLIIPALILIPVLLGLRYGFAGGAIAAMLLISVIQVFSYFQPGFLLGVSKGHTIVLLLGGCISGQFRDYWAARLRQIDLISHQYKIRSEKFTSTFHFLQLSHAKLERQLAGTATSLRTSLQRLKAQSRLVAGPQHGLGSQGPWVLDLLAEAGNLRAASIYAVNENGRIAALPEATIGKPVELSPFNPLLREALRLGVVTSIHPGDTDTGGFIAVVPLIDSRGRIHGVVSINEMPFIAIHQRTFDLLGVIAQEVGDVLGGRCGVVCDAETDRAMKISLEESLIHVRRDHAQVTIIAYKILDESKAEMLVSLCLDESRGLDQSWLYRDRDDHPVVLKILSMADINAARSQFQRLQQQMMEQHGRAMADSAIAHYIWELEGSENADQILEKIILRCDLQIPANSQRDPSQSEALAS